MGPACTVELQLRRGCTGKGSLFFSMTQIECVVRRRNSNSGKRTLVVGVGKAGMAIRSIHHYRSCPSFSAVFRVLLSSCVASALAAVQRQEPSHLPFLAKCSRKQLAAAASTHASRGEGEGAAPSSSGLKGNTLYTLPLLSYGPMNQVAQLKHALMLSKLLGR